MENFELEADHAELWLPARKGKRVRCKLSAADLAAVTAFSGQWRAAWDAGSRTFYAVSNKPYGLMHRIIAAAPDGLEVDHVNHDGLDNRRCNLRVCTRRENALNRKGANRNSATGMRGVYSHRKTGKFRAWVYRDGQRKEIGGYATPEQAQEARRRA